MSPADQLLKNVCHAALDALAALDPHRDRLPEHVVEVLNLLRVEVGAAMPAVAAAYPRVLLGDGPLHDVPGVGP